MKVAQIFGEIENFNEVPIKFGLKNFYIIYDFKMFVK